MNNLIPSFISHFIQQHHVTNIACQADNQFWTASCFYAFDEVNKRLIILTNQNTLHGKLMLKNPMIVGTISGQPIEIDSIEGIQFRATVRVLQQQAEQNIAKSLYCKRHTYAEKMQSDIWEICFEYIKHTSNKVHFAQKTEWFR